MPPDKGQNIKQAENRGRKNQSPKTIVHQPMHGDIFELLNYLIDHANIISHSRESGNLNKA